MSIKDKIVYADGDRRFVSLSVFFRVLLMLVRGIPNSILARRSIFLAKGANVNNINYLRGAGLIKADESCLIQCLSKSGVTIGHKVSFGAFCQLRPSSQYGGILGEGCLIGDGTTFGPFAYIGCGGFIYIGKNCMFGPRVTIIAENHIIPEAGKELKDAGITRKGISIGDGCWIGANVVVLDGSKIGNGVVIGAGSVVNSDIPDNSVCVGTPARVIKYRK